MTQQAQNDEYLALVAKLATLSKLAVRQFLGTRPEGDPRVDYLAGLEGAKNMLIAQVAALTSMVTAMMGDNLETFRVSGLAELTEQVESMEKELAVVGWDGEGSPLFDLKASFAQTKDWPD